VTTSRSGAYGLHQAEGFGRVCVEWSQRDYAESEDSIPVTEAVVNLHLDERQIEVLDPAMVKVLRRKTGPERLRIANDIWVSTRIRLEAYLQREHPDWDAEKVNQEILRRLQHGSA